METKEIPVPSTENVEETTEQTPKTYTEAEFNAKLDEVLGKKIARNNAKIRKEYEQQYGGLAQVLRAGTGKEDLAEITQDFRDFYSSKGINIPTGSPRYTEKETQILAKADAEDIIACGMADVVEEVDRLAELGLENMTQRDKAVFQILAQHRQQAEKNQALAQLGVTADVYKSKDFQSFAKKFAENTPISEVYALYEKLSDKKDIKPMGSMKTTGDEGSNEVKDYYSPEEAKKFSRQDFDKNPKLFQAVQASMLRWK